MNQSWSNCNFVFMRLHYQAAREGESEPQHHLDELTVLLSG